MLQETAARHNGHLCPRQVLGVRMGLLAAEIFGLELPQRDKRLFAFVETDGCLTDGIAIASGCWWGRRTMRLVDYGKTAVTFVDTVTGRAVRISPQPEARLRCLEYAPAETDSWRAQLLAYQLMPAQELLLVHEVQLVLSLADILSKPGVRVVCEQCGEDIINERYVRQGDRLLCRACAGGAYYEMVQRELISHA